MPQTGKGIGAATTTPWGQLRTQQDSTQLFLDTFNVASFDPNRWNTSSGGGGVAPAQSVGSAVVNSGTTANGFSMIQSVPTFLAQEPGWVSFTGRINLEFPFLKTGYRFWGLSTNPATPTIAAAVTEGVGFEIFTDGNMYAVTYQTGTRLVIAQLTGNSNQSLNFGPSDNLVHKYYIFFRPDLTYWCLDDIDNVVASFLTGASGPNVNNLPQTRLAVSNGGTAVTITENGTSVGDTVRNNMTLSDSFYGFRQQSVGARGDAIVSQIDGNKLTYSAAFTAAAGVTGDLLTIQGGTGRAIRVTRVSLSGTATAATDVDVTLVKRSTADTGGTATALTAVPHDSNNSAAVASVSLWTAAPTPGTSIGTIRSEKVLANVATAQAELLEWIFGVRPGAQAPVLRGGSAATIALTLSSAPAGGSWDGDIEWTEE